MAHTSMLLGFAIATLMQNVAMADGICRKAADQDALNASRRTTVQCIVDNAKRLEPSGETAIEVATAAVQACDDDLRRTFSVVNDHCSHVRSGIWDYGYDASIPLEFDDQERRQARDFAVRVVTEVRARRATAVPPAPATAP